MHKAKYCVVLAFWLVLEWVCSAGATAALPPYPEPPNYPTPMGCYDTSLVYEGGQFGHTETATIVFSTAAGSPDMVHVVVQAQQGFWLLQIRGGWIGLDGPDGFAWNNTNPVSNRSYERDDYGAGIGIVATTCPDDMLAAEVTTTTVVSTTTIHVATTSTTPTSQPPVRPVIATPNFTG